MHHLIFVPDANPDDGATALEDVGLGDHVEFASGIHSEAPDGTGCGMLFWWRKPSEGGAGFAIESERQMWIPAAADGDKPTGRYFVGINNASPPTPADLLRPFPRLGTFVTLGDGRDWQILEPATFPIVDTRLREHQRETIAWLDRIELMSRLTIAGRSDVDEAASLNLDDVCRFIVQTLSLNYRITPEVVSHLRLLNTGNAINPALFTALGLKQVLEV